MKLDIKKLILKNIVPLAVGFIATTIVVVMQFQLPDWLQMWMIAPAGFLGIKVMMYFRSLNKKNFKTNVEYGSAKWGKRDDIAPFMDKNPKNNIILTQTESLTMNNRPRPAKLARNKNVLVIGGSGSGKTRFYAKPNLMQCESTDYPVSFVVTDPKGTILVEMGDFLRKKGYIIKVLNTYEFKKSMRYNPFAYIRSEDDVLKFVTTLIANTKGESGGGGDDFWLKAETLLYQALIGYIIFELPKPDQNINTLVEMINSMETREDKDDFKNEVDILFDQLENGFIKPNGEKVKPKPNHFAVRQYKKYKLAAGKTAKSILISCGARLSVFDIKAVRDMMSEDEMELDKLGGYQEQRIIRKKDKATGKITTTTEKKIIKRKTAFFVIIPDTDATYNFIVGIMYSQLFNLLCYKADALYYKG